MICCPHCGKAITREKALVTEDVVSIIKRVCAEYFGVTVEQIDGRLRSARFNDPRHAFRVVTIRLTEMTPHELARMAGADAGTVYHSLNQADAPHLKDRIDEVERRVREVIA